MIKSLARAVSLGSLLCAPLAGAYQFGEHAAGTVDKLIHDYPGRYSETASFRHAFQRWSGLAPSELRR